MSVIVGVCVIVSVGVTMSVAVGAPVVSAVGVTVQDSHDEEVAAQSENAGDEHDNGVVYNLSVDHPLGGLNKEFGSDHVDDSHVYEGPQGLGLLPPKGQELGRVGSGAQPDSPQGDEVGQHIRKQVEGISEDSDGVGGPPPDQFDSHEEQRHFGDADELTSDLSVLLVHRN